MEHTSEDESGTLQRRPFGETLATILGLNRITPYIDRFTTISNLHYGTTLAIIIATLDTFMIENSFAMSRNPDVIAKVGWEWIIHHRIAYCAQLLSALILAAAFLLEWRRRRAGRDLPLLPIKFIITQFIAGSFAFGIYISYNDLTRGNGLYAFLTQATSIVCIFVIRPIALIPLLLGSFAFMAHAAEQAGALSHGTSINLQMLGLILTVSSSIKYYHHMREGTQRERLLHQSYLDALTGLGNLRALCRDMRDMMGQEIAIVVLDLDNFKLFNDVHSHDAGNRALSLLASILRMEFDGTASLYRLHGDEFAIISPAASQEDTLTRARCSREALLRRATQYGLIAEGRPISFSMGTAIGTVSSTDSVDEILHRADTAMYEEKRARHAARN